MRSHRARGEEDLAEKEKEPDGARVVGVGGDERDWRDGGEMGRGRGRGREGRKPPRGLWMPCVSTRHFAQYFNLC